MTGPINQPVTGSIHAPAKQRLRRPRYSRLTNEGKAETIAIVTQFAVSLAGNDESRLTTLLPGLLWANGLSTIIVPPEFLKPPKKATMKTGKMPTPPPEGIPRSTPRTKLQLPRPLAIQRLQQKKPAPAPTPAPVTAPTPASTAATTAATTSSSPGMEISFNFSFLKMINKWNFLPGKPSTPKTMQDPYFEPSYSALTPPGRHNVPIVSYNEPSYCADTPPGRRTARKKENYLQKQQDGPAHQLLIL